MARLILALVLCCAAACTPAAAKPAQTELDGTVTDQTMTVAGYEFYRHFCVAWHDRPLADVAVLAIRELPSARRGTQVVVEYAGRAVFQASLPANRGGVRNVSERAVEAAHQYIADAGLARLLVREPDLGADEF